MNNLNKILQERFCVLYAETEEERNLLENEILKMDPSYKTEVPDIFRSKAKNLGPIKIKDKRTIEDILKSNKNLMKKGQTFLTKQLEVLDIKDYIYRRTASLSTYQRLRFSLIMDIADGKRHFLWHDEELKTPATLCSMLMFWFDQLDEFKNQDGKFVYISKMRREEYDAFLEEYYREIKYHFYEYRNGSFSLVESSKYKEQKKLVVKLIENVEKNGVSENNDTLLENIHILNEIEYYDKLIAILNEKLDDAFIEEETMKRCVDVSMPCEKWRDNLKEKMLHYSEEDKAFIEKNKEKKIKAILTLKDETNAKVIILSAFAQLEEFNKVAKDEDLYMTMANFAFFYMEKSKKDGKNAEYYANKYESYLEQALTYGHEDAEDKLDYYRTFKGKEKLQEKYDMAMKILSNRHATVGEYNFAVDLAEDLLKEDAEFILSKISHVLRNYCEQLYNEKKDYKYVYDLVISYYEKMEQLKIKYAKEDHEHFIAYFIR